MKTAISLPDPLFKAAEQAASRLGLSRSELYATAIARFLRDEGGAEITRTLDRVLAKERSSLDRVLARVQAASLGADEGGFEDWVDVPKAPRPVPRVKAQEKKAERATRGRGRR